MIVFLLIIILALILFLFGRIFNKKDIFKYPFIISIIAIILLSVLSFKVPLFSFLFAVISSCFLMILSLPYRFLNVFQEKLLLKTLSFLYRTCILDWLAVIHIKFFAADRLTLFYRFFIVFSVSLLHIFLSRWYFFQKVFQEKTFSMEMQLIILCCLFIGIAVSYFRFLLSFSLFILPITLKYAPSYLSESVLYVLGDDLPQSTSNTSLPEKKFSLLNISFTRNYFRQYYTKTGTSTFKYAGFCVGVCAMGAAFATAIYAKEQTEYSRQQAYDTRRQADAAAVDNGLITKEEYWRRHPQDALHKPKND